MQVYTGKEFKPRMQLIYEDCGTGTTREQGKALQPSIIYYLQALTQFYLTGHGATTFTQINKERPPQRQGGQTGPVGLYNVGLGGPKESHETVQVTFTLVVP